MEIFLLNHAFAIPSKNTGNPTEELTQHSLPTGCLNSEPRKGEINSPPHPALSFWGKPNGVMTLFGHSFNI